jgi:UDP-GlcNAc:undecaprenyl-phosphate/decaprenyl-phosphate GlcNAc-1-phosphate transferase
MQYVPAALMFLVSLGVCLLMAPAVRALAFRFDLVDHPDQERKRHERAVPRVGGIAVMLGFFSAMALLLAPGSPLGDLLDPAKRDLLLRLLPAVCIVFAAGLIDDIRGLRPWQKLAAQFVAALLACEAGVEVTGVGGRHLDPWMSVPVTLLWLMLSSNAFNLIDGLDGLAAGLGLSAASTIFVVALICNDGMLALATAPLAGALLGFLRYNFHPASIFLGDSGSLTIGFLLGCFGVIWSQKATTFLGMAAPLMALAVPLLDTFLSVARRFLRGDPVFRGDAGHLHHKLLEHGFGRRGAALVLYAVCGVASVFSIWQSVAREHVAVVLPLAFVLLAWLGIHKIRYVEFGAARQVLFGGTVRRSMRAEVGLDQFRKSLDAADSLEECWESIRRAAASLGFPRVRMRIGGTDFDSRPEHWTGAGCWCLRVPLTSKDFIELDCDASSSTQLLAAAGFARVVRDGMQSRLTLSVVTRMALASGD